MSNFTEIKWDNGSGLELLDTFGIKPCKALTEAINIMVEYAPYEVRGEEDFKSLLVLLQDRLDEVSNKLGELCKAGLVPGLQPNKVLGLDGKKVK